MKPGQHDREMNPYWKQGGTGLPEDIPSSKKKDTSTSSSSSTYKMGDCGVGWLKKALDRCYQQAKEENKSVEEIAAAKYGVWSEMQLVIIFIVNGSTG